MKKEKKVPDWAVFILKTLFYAAVILTLIFLYMYNQVDGGNFIYNDF